MHIISRIIAQLNQTALSKRIHALFYIIPVLAEELSYYLEAATIEI